MNVKNGVDEKHQRLDRNEIVSPCEKDLGIIASNDINTRKYEIICHSGQYYSYYYYIIII